MAFVPDGAQMTQDEAKQLVAERAVEFVEDGMAVGLGTGTTATLFIRELGKRVQKGTYI
jgi:ribose 5-phosphate isomerase A